MNWQNEVERCTAALAADRLDALASSLGVTVAALKAVGIGWAGSADIEKWRAGFGDGERPDGAFTFPERDGNGRIIGLSLRAPDGRKGSPSGAKRGLIVPSDCHKLPDPVLVVEGASDTAALVTLGLSAVGRPSNSSGGDMLAALLDGRDVLVIGENDPKETGAWPGRDGAKAIARRLASERGEPVLWAIPPAESKDVRSWLQAKVASGLDLADSAACKAAGAELLGALQATARKAKPERKPTQADQLARLAADAGLWHTTDSDAYATIPVGNHRETQRVRSKAFRQWLVGRAYRGGGRVPNAEAIQAALAAIEARAVFDGPEQSAFTRLAEHEGAVYLDLADADWRAVRIDADGWSIVDDPPVRFRRPGGMRPLPTPERGGNIRELLRIVNVDADGLTLTSAFLLGALNPRGPYPVLPIHGPQGAGKSCATRILKSIIDPNESPLRTAPCDERDLCIAAENSWIVTLNNLSGLAPWLSDSLCRLATGGGLATRELYTDREETIFSATRPVILNSIEDVVTRPDLLDRSIIVNLEPFSESEKRTEAELWRDFDELHPRLLGALLSAASTALRNLPTVKLDARPRMLDFATWAVAGETALGLEPGVFLAAYCGNRADANALALECSPVAGALQDFIEAVGDWTGTATALLAELDGRATDAVRKARTWPRTPTALAGKLRRIAPNLAAVGLAVSFDRTGKRRDRLIRAEKVPIPASAPSALSAPPLFDRENADSEPEGRTLADAPGPAADAGRPPDRPPENGPGAIENTEADAADGADALSPSYSGDVADAPDGELPPASDEDVALADMDPMDPAELDDPDVFEARKRAVGIDPAKARGVA